MLGHITHPKLQELGDLVRFPLQDSLALKQIRAAAYAPIATKVITLTVDRVGLPSGMILLAVKNNDYPIDDLKRIPGFEALNGEEADDEKSAGYHPAQQPRPGEGD